MKKSSQLSFDLSMTLSDWLRQQPFQLVLSSGYFGFFAHCGFCHALESENIYPSKYIGCSAGALVASYLASGKSALELRDLFYQLEKHEFWDPGIGFGLLRGRKFEDKLNENLVETFEQCHIPLQVVVLDIFKWKNKTISSGKLSAAVRASCAVPGLFHPVKIDGRWYWDGGVTDKIALTDVPDETRLFSHFLYSEKKKNNVDLTRFIKKDNPNWRSLAIQNIIRVGPDKLKNGPKAYEQAFEITKSLLAKPLSEIHRTHLAKV